MADNASISPTVEKQTVSYRHIWWLLLFAVIGVVIYSTKNDEVFADASLNLSVPKEKVTAIGEEWAVKLGYDPNEVALGGTVKPVAITENGGSAVASTPDSDTPGAEVKRAAKPKTKLQNLKSLTFSYDDDAKTFLEYELGGHKANELMVNEIPVWYWRLRMAKELQQEEMSVWISPDGKLSGVDHSIENDKAMPSIDHKAAEVFVRNFVENQVGQSLDGYALIKNEEDERPKRKDHSFTFEADKPDYKGAKMRVFVSVAGDKIKAYNRYLHVPEAWKRKFETMRSYNNSLGSIAQVFMTLLNYASGFVFCWAIVSGNIRWRPAILLATIYAVFPFIDGLNNFNEIIDSYDTGTTYVSYIAKTITALAAAILPKFVTGLVLFGAAEALYRKMFPQHISVEGLFTLKGMKSKPFLLALLVGHLLFMIDLGWVVFYYLVGQKIHFWCPLGVENYQILSSYLPAISAVGVGISASFMEEALYRMVGLGLLMRFTGNFWLSNFLQAAAWGFAHSTYPQQPAYARGLELTLGGMLDGWILKKYGILACVASHYLFDTFLGAKTLFSSKDPTMQVTAYLSVVPFAVAALIGYARSRNLAKQEVPPELLNGSITTTVKVKEILEETPEEKTIRYTPIAPQQRLFLFVVTVLFGFTAFVVKPQSLGSDESVHRMDRARAEELAQKSLARHGIETRGYSVVSRLTQQTTSDSNQYLFEKVGFDKTEKLIKATHSGGYFWRVRYYKPNVPDEYEVQIDAEGREIGFDISLAEETPGKFLKKEEALALAKTEFEKTYPYLTPYEVQSASEQKRPARTDWTFVFRSPQYDGPETQFKSTMFVVGDLVSGASWQWELPDKWKWAFSQLTHTPRHDAASYLRVGMWIFGIALVLVWLYGVLKSGAVRLRSALILGGIFSTLAVISRLNSLPSLFAGYSTDTPVANFLLNVIASYLQTWIVSFCSSVFLIGLALASLRILFPLERASRVFSALIKPHNKENRAAQRAMWVDGALSGYAYVAAAAFFGQMFALLRSYYSPEIQEASLSSVAGMMNMLFPAGDLLLSSLVDGVQQIFIFAVAAGFYAKYCRSILPYLVFSGTYSLINCLSDRYWQDSAIDFGASMVNFILGWLFATRIGRKNPVAYFTYGMAALLFSRFFSIFVHGLPQMMTSLAVAAFLLAAPAIVAALLSMRTEPMLPMVPPSPPTPTEPEAPVPELFSEASPSPLSPLEALDSNTDKDEKI